MEAKASHNPFPSKVEIRKLKVYPNVNPLTRSTIRITGVPNTVNDNAIIIVIRIRFFLSTFNNKTLLFTGSLTILYVNVEK